MARHQYEEVRLVHAGYLDALKCLPTRASGESADDWLARCDETAYELLEAGEIDREFAGQMVSCAEILADELRRYPTMIGWSHREYYAAADFGIPPHDDQRRFRATAETLFPSETAEDAFIDQFLYSLIAAPENARA